MSRAGGSPRLIAFAIIFVINLVFIVLSSFGVLPLAAQITAVAISGTSIGVMAVFNIIGDITIIRSMFSAPGAVFYALTPVPRKKTLTAGLITMFLIDFITMVVSIASVVILSINLGSHYSGMNAWSMIRTYGTVDFENILLPLALVVAGYLFLIMFIIFCTTIRKSYFYNKPAGGLFTFLLAVGVLYIFSLTPLILTPFANVTRYYAFFTVTVGYLGMGLYALIIFIITAIMFTLSAYLMENKINI